MNMSRYGVAVGLLASLGACSNMTGSSSHASRPAATQTAVQPTVAPDMIKNVQAKLHDDGYYKQGAIDGVWGLQTENAVRSFQQAHNLGSSGQLDVPTLAALNVTSTARAATDTTVTSPTTDANGHTIVNNNANLNTQPTITSPNPQATPANPNLQPATNATTPPPR